MKNPEQFGKLLKEGIRAIQKHESVKKKKRLADIRAELGEAIGRKLTTIEHFEKGHIPTTDYERRTLIKEVVKRGKKEREWAEEFIESAGYPNPSRTYGEFFPPIDIEGNQTTSGHPAHLYKFKTMSAEKQLSIDGSITSHNHVEIEAIGNSPVAFVSHRRVATSSETFQNLITCFEPGSRAGNGTMHERIVTKNERLFIWYVDFSPSLTKRQRASYSYRHSYHGTYHMTFEQCQEAYNRGDHRFDFEQWEFRVTVPTEELHMRFVFPVGYKITLPSTGGFAVYAGLSENHQEKTRLIAENAFSCNTSSDVWTLELVTRPARVGLTYALQWVPPLSSSLGELGV